MKPQDLISALREAKVNDFHLVDKELKFGSCEIEDKNGTKAIVASFIGRDFRNDDILGEPKHEFMQFKYNAQLAKLYLDDIKILGTPPHMERVMAFMFKKINWRHEWKNELHRLWIVIDPAGSHHFFWLIENSGDHYNELLSFCKQYILDG